MTPLQASLIFVFISILVSIFRHLFLHSPSLNNSEDSNISLTRIHTLTVAQSSSPKGAYNSLYEAYFKPIDTKPVQPQLPYNSFALKKAILNNEGVYLCDQKFAAIFEERIFCEDPKGTCRWQTIITVYRLPFLKKEESRSVSVEGRILTSGNKEDELTCRRKSHIWQNYFQLNFVLILNSKQHKKGPKWMMHSLQIQQQYRQGWQGDSPFALKLLKWNLKNVQHYPLLYSFDEKCLSYITQEQPWLVHYNCADSWSTFNILSDEIQNSLFQRNSSIGSPPFTPAHHAKPLFFRLYSSTLKTYTRPENCLLNLLNCPKQQHVLSRHFITFVFEVANSPLRFGKTITQITFVLGEGERQGGIVSFNTLGEEINLQRKVYIDCSISNKEYKLLKASYTYQLGLGQDNVVAQLQRHSMICVCAHNYAEQLKIVEIQDLLGFFNASELPHELIIRSKQVLEQKKIQNSFLRKINGRHKKQETSQDSSWFDWFDFFNFKFSYEDPQEKDIVSDISEVSLEARENDEIVAEEKKQKKIKPKKLKRNKKGKKQRKEDSLVKIIFPDDLVGQKLQQITEQFVQLGENQPIQSDSLTIAIPMPIALTSDSKFRIVNSDLEYPLIYLEASKKFLLTYQLKEDDDSSNQTLRHSYAYKYSQIGIDSKPSVLHLSPSNNNDTKFKRKEEVQIDRFLIDIMEQNSDILNSIKSISVVEVKMNEGGSILQALAKPFRRNVIVAWGWGIEVYEVNWDWKGLRTQVADIEQQLNPSIEGMQMATLLPFIQLFATVYCLFQALTSSR